MPFSEEWTPMPQATIEELAAQCRPSYFLHNRIIYLGFLEPETLPKRQDLWYRAIARDTAMATSFHSSTIVTPSPPHTSDSPLTTIPRAPVTLGPRCWVTARGAAPLALDGSHPH